VKKKYNQKHYRTTLSLVSEQREVDVGNSLMALHPGGFFAIRLERFDFQYQQLDLLLNLNPKN
jgi:hypothetical protein